jgi:hypothetical protein
VRFCSHNLVALVLGVCLAAHAQVANPSKATPSAAEILEKYLAATGGIEGRKALQSLIVEGRVSDDPDAPQLPLGEYTYSFKAPKSDVLSVIIISHGLSWTGHRNGEPFRRATIGGLQMIEQVDTAIVEQDLYSLLEWDFAHSYRQMEVTATTRIANRPAYVVKFMTRSGDLLVRYYDTRTFLLLRMDQTQRAQGGKDQPGSAYLRETYFSDYRDYGLLKLPHTITIRGSLTNLVFTIGKAKLNAKVSDSAFR